MKIVTRPITVILNVLVMIKYSSLLSFEAELLKWPHHSWQALTNNFNSQGFQISNLQFSSKLEQTAVLQESFHIKMGRGEAYKSERHT